MQSLRGVNSSAIYFAGSLLGVFFLLAVLLQIQSFDETDANGLLKERIQLLPAAVEEKPVSNWQFRPPALDYKQLGPEFTSEPWWEQFESNRTLYIYNTAGTGNTIRNVATALTYAYENKINVKLMFRERYAWDNLFEFPNITNSVFPDGHRNPLQAALCKTVARNTIVSLAEKRDFEWNRTPEGDGEVGCLNVCCWWEKPFGPKQMWLFRVLKPIPFLRDLMDEFKAKKKWSEYRIVGIHIRRSDNLDHMQKRLKAASGREEFADRFNLTDFESVLPIDNYVKRMQELLDTLDMVRVPSYWMEKDIRFFLATDNDEAREYVTSQFEEGMVFSFEHNVTSSRLRSDVWGIQLGLIDLFLLGSCEAIIGTPHSSFTETAAMLRGIPRFDPQFGWNETTKTRLAANSSHSCC